VNEVETILNEIRERVRADHEQGSTPVQLVVQNETSAAEAQPVNADLRNTASLNLLAAHLTTTTRAWDRLPPVNSNRSGGAARIELWVKTRLKSMSRWFTWEQINFNSAVHHALSETLSALSGYAHELARQEHELARLRSELLQEGDAGRAKLDRVERELAALRAAFDAQTAEARQREASLEARSAAIEAHLAAFEARADKRESEMAAETLAQIDSARTQLASQFSQAIAELRESDDQLREEQRVCFKQLSLEASEAAVMADRARRVLESRLDQLEKDIVARKSRP
jgi:hypothetical protein